MGVLLKICCIFVEHLSEKAPLGDYFRLGSIYFQIKCLQLIYYMKQVLIKHFCYKIWYSLSIFIEKANIFVPIAHRNQQKALWISVDFRGYRMKYWSNLGSKTFK